MALYVKNYVPVALEKVTLFFAQLGSFSSFHQSALVILSAIQVNAASPLLEVERWGDRGMKTLHVKLGDAGANLIAFWLANIQRCPRRCCRKFG